MRAFCFVLSLGLLVGCTPKEQPVPPPVSHTPPGLWDALTAEETWRPPVVLAEPESAPPEPPPPPPPGQCPGLRLVAKRSLPDCGPGGGRHRRPV